MRIRQNCRKKTASVTLIEFMIGSAIATLLLATILALSSYTVRSFAAISNYVTLERGSRKALDRLSMMIREADGVTEFRTNRIQLSYHGTPLIYSFDAGTKTMAETHKGETTTL